MVIKLLEEILDYSIYCECEKNQPFSNIIDVQELDTDEIFTWERFFKIRGIFCLNCKKIIEFKYKKLVNDNVFFKIIPHHFNLYTNYENSLKFLNKFKNRNVIFYSTIVKTLKAHYYEYLTLLWKNGIIKIHRRKKNPNLTTPDELGKKIPAKIKEKIVRNDLDIVKISLTEKGRNFLEIELNWDINSLVLKRKKDFQKIKQKWLKILGKCISNKKDSRIQKILTIINSQNIINGRTAQLGSYHFNIIKKFDEFIFFFELLIYISLKINLEQIIFLKKYTKNKSPLPNHIRYTLKQIIKSPLILFNIFREPFGIETEKDVIFEELQQFILNKFESELTSFIINKIEEITPSNELWSIRIPNKVKKKIEDNYLHRHHKIYGKSETLVAQELQDLINNFKLTELLDFTLFGSISKLITKETNWNDIFKLIYPQFRTLNKFQEEFEKLNLVRILVAHKKRKRTLNIKKFLRFLKWRLSEILEKFYILYNPCVT